MPTDSLPTSAALASARAGFPETAPVGFGSGEVLTSESTRAARLKWVIVVDRALAPGLAVNAAACIAASVGASVAGLIGPGGDDADGQPHPGLPWAGCSVLGATAEELVALRAAAVAFDASASPEAAVYLTDMPASAQTNRVYDGYVTELAETPAERLAVSALSIVGPRKTVDKLTKRLALL